MIFSDFGLTIVGTSYDPAPTVLGAPAPGDQKAAASAATKGALTVQRVDSITVAITSYQTPDALPLPPAFTTTIPTPSVYEIPPEVTIPVRQKAGSGPTPDEINVLLQSQISQDSAWYESPLVLWGGVAAVLGAVYLSKHHGAAPMSGYRRRRRR